jgi:hypothetical protein
MTNMLHFLNFLFLGVCAYLTSNEKSNYSRHPVLMTTGFPPGFVDYPLIFWHKTCVAACQGV